MFVFVCVLGCWCLCVFLVVGVSVCSWLLLFAVNVCVCSWLLVLVFVCVLGCYCLLLMFVFVCVLGCWCMCVLRCWCYSWLLVLGCYSLLLMFVFVCVIQEPSNWQLFMFSVEVILVPHYIVGMCAWHWSSSHGFLCMAILIHCLWTTQREAKQAIAYVSSRHAMHWRQEMMILGKGLLYNVVTCAGLVICSAILWPVVPYFLCNFLLHWTIWYTAFTLACKPVKLLIVRRPQHIRRPRQDGIP